MIRIESETGLFHEERGKKDEAVGRQSKTFELFDFLKRLDLIAVDVT